MKIPPFAIVPTPEDAPWAFVREIAAKVEEERRVLQIRMILGVGEDEARRLASDHGAQTVIDAGILGWMPGDGTMGTATDDVSVTTNSVSTLALEIERMGTAFGEAFKETATALSDLILLSSRFDDHPGHWTFNPPEEPRPVSDFVPRCRPAARPRQRGVSPRKNRARSRVGGKTAARRVA